jgi:hypothetical protein
MNVSSMWILLAGQRGGETNTKPTTVSADIAAEQQSVGELALRR